MTHEETEGCEFCGSVDYDISATLVRCKGCGRVWGRVNGAWVLDPDSGPQEYVPLAPLAPPMRPTRPAPSVGRLLLLVSAVRAAAIEAQDAAASGNADGAMQRAKAIQKLVDTMTAVLEGREE